MKAYKLFLGLALAFGSLSFSGCDKESIVSASDLPSQIQDYVTAHFPNNNILQVTKDREGFKHNYELILDESITLEFNKKHEIVDIDGISKLPDSVVPEKLLLYISTNFTENYIIGWEKEDKNQEIKLDNDMDLVFNMNGDFLKIDD